jgi:hypothetical protein
VFPTESYSLRTPLDDRHAAVALADQLGMALLRHDPP